jgi:hypothetical protein
MVATLLRGLPAAHAEDRAGSSGDAAPLPDEVQAAVR